MSEDNLYQAIQAVLVALRNGGREFSKYIKWLKDAGLEQGEAEDLLDRLTRQIEEES